MPTRTVDSNERSGFIMSSKAAAGQQTVNDTQVGLSEQPQTIVHEVAPARGVRPSQARAIVEARNKSDKPLPTPTVPALNVGENDFGFSFSDTSEEEEKLDYETLYRNATNQLTKVVGVFNTLLDNLAKNPDQQFIKWPNRVEAINKIKTQLQEALKA